METQQKLDIHAPQNQTTVYFDGLCILCSREIHHYQALKGAENLRFVDITASEFDPAAEGVDPFEVHRVMHVRRSDGTLALEVAAFVEIWSRLPRYQFLASWARNAGFRKILDSSYRAFVKVRPYLPRKKQLCENSPYCEVKR